MRVIVSALAICAVSFLAGVAGDLSSASARQEAPARPQVVELPPMQLPPVDLTSAVRAHPLAPRSAAQRAADTARLRPVSLVIPSPLAAEPVLVSSEFESLAGGPADSALERPALRFATKHPGKPNAVLAGKAGEERAFKA